MTLPPAPFIVGTGRCGTTLLRLMLDAHPELAIPPETHFVPAALRACRRSLLPRRAFRKAATSAPFWQDFGMDEGELARRLEGVRPFETGGALRAFYGLYAEGRGKSRWGDKTPFYVLHMRAIREALPEARFIHLIRDGRDVALSFRGLWFGPDSVAAAAEHWVSRIEAARRQAPALRDAYLEVRYEDLVLGTEPTLRKVCDFIGLGWTDAMLDYHLTARARLAEMAQPLRARRGRVVGAEERKAIHSLTAQPPRPDRVNIWKSEMPPADRALFERVAGQLLRGLGYDVSTPEVGAALDAASRSPPRVR
jgi:hypothetical protein